MSNNLTFNINANDVVSKQIYTNNILFTENLGNVTGIMSVQGGKLYLNGSAYTDTINIRGPQGAGFQSIVGGTSNVNVLTANGDNSAIGNQYLTYNSGSSTLYVGDPGILGPGGSIETYNLKLKGLSNTNDDNKFLTIDSNGKVNYNQGMTYPNTNYRETTTFTFKDDNTTPGMMLPAGDSNVGVFFLPSNVRITYIGLTFMSYHTAAPLNISLYNVTGQSSVTGGIPLHTTVGINNSNNIVSTFSTVLSQPVTVSSDSAIGIRLNTGSNGQWRVYSLMLGLASN